MFISFKTEDANYKTEIQSWDHLDYVDKSLDEPIPSDDQDYIMRRIRSDYLKDSTVTIFLIGTHSSEDMGAVEQYYIKKELQGSLYNGVGNSKSGLLGVVLPSMQSSVYLGDYTCFTCGGTHRHVNMGNSTVIKEFGYNYFIPNEKCSWSEEDRYCVLATWDEFRLDPERYIDEAFDKRTAPIAAHTKVRP
ncbi:TIR domain-containing protein [Rhodococcoides fascians]|uniref:TIR domain-containing protein n=1 Tax=Rhodococcoides fascians TaxID=1828 RepID=UPI001FCA0FCD|nr:TIR domain-containing protein [Rhodococcus fascians]